MRNDDVSRLWIPEQCRFLQPSIVPNWNLGNRLMSNPNSQIVWIPAILKTRFGTEYKTRIEVKFEWGLFLRGLVAFPIGTFQHPQKAYIPKEPPFPYCYLSQFPLYTIHPLNRNRDILMYSFVPMYQNSKSVLHSFLCPNTNCNDFVLDSNPFEQSL